MTIEERAKEYLESEMEKEEFGCGGGLDEIKQAYEQGATDQRKIDIDKACEWIANFIKAYGIDDPLTPNESLFKEAMEE